MHTFEPSVVECLEARAVVQDIRASEAYKEGNRINGDIYSRAAAETRAEIEHYKLNSFLQRA
jgi:hypothetical protein